MRGPTSTPATTLPDSELHVTLSMYLIGNERLEAGPLSHYFSQNHSARFVDFNMESKVALVAGANGISGNAIVEHLIRTPKEEW